MKNRKHFQKRWKHLNENRWKQIVKEMTQIEKQFQHVKQLKFHNAM